jgi:type I restriction enzyme S subunit
MIGKKLQHGIPEKQSILTSHFVYTTSERKNLPIEQCLEKTKYKRLASIPLGEYKPKGRFPIIDQGVDYIEGWTDAEEHVVKDGLPVVIFGDHTRIFKYVDFPFATGADGTKILRADLDLLDPLFFYYALKALQIPNKGYSRHYKYLRELLIAFPTDKSEQRAIAGALDTVRKANQGRQRELALERERKTALMEYLFAHGTQGEPSKLTEIGEIPKSWELVKLGKIAKIGNGSTPKRSNESYWKNGTTPWITSTQIHNTMIARAYEFVTETARKECHLPLVPKGSVVVAITGQGKTLGNAAILAIDTCINQHLAYIRFEDPSVHAQFVLFYLQSKYLYLRGVGSAGGSTKGALTCGFLKGMSIPIPSFEEQSAIAALLLACETMCRSLEKEVVLLDELFNAILEELMTGRLSAMPLIEEHQRQ